MLDSNDARDSVTIPSGANIVWKLLQKAKEWSNINPVGGNLTGWNNFGAKYILKINYHRLEGPRNLPTSRLRAFPNRRMNFTPAAMLKWSNENKLIYFLWQDTVLLLEYPNTTI